MHELVVDGEHGFLVQARDPHALAAAIERLVADPAKRRQMGLDAAARVRSSFDQERALNRLEALYLSLVP
jgi:glycosyltransferase involved in cell wall biosynthesis